MAKSKVVMVTGASSGLGRDFCVDLARSGHVIVAAARRTDRLESLCDEINELGCRLGSVRAVAVELDVSGKSAEIEAAVEKAWDVFGRIDVLVNNAGIRGTSAGVGFAIPSSTFLKIVPQLIQFGKEHLQV